MTKEELIERLERVDQEWTSIVDPPPFSHYVATQFYLAGLEAAKGLCKTMEFQDMTDDDEAKYVKMGSRGHDIPMGFHADRLAEAIDQLIQEAKG